MTGILDYYADDSLAFSTDYSHGNGSKSSHMNVITCVCVIYTLEDQTMVLISTIVYINRLKRFPDYASSFYDLSRVTNHRPYMHAVSRKIVEATVQSFKALHVKQYSL